MFSEFDNFIIRHQNELSADEWRDISKKYELSVEMMRLFQNKIFWFYIAKYQTLSLDFIKEFMNDQLKNYMDVVCRHQQLTPEFIEEFKDIIDWDVVIENQSLPLDFILKHLDDIHKFRNGVDEVD